MSININEKQFGVTYIELHDNKLQDVSVCTGMSREDAETMFGEGIADISKVIRKDNTNKEPWEVLVSTPTHFRAVCVDRNGENILCEQILTKITDDTLRCVINPAERTINNIAWE